MIGIDLIGPISVSNGYLVVAVDYLTKWREVAALINKKAGTITAFFEENLIAGQGRC